MSFDSTLEIALIEGEPPDFDRLQAVILKQLEGDGVHQDVFSDVKDAFINNRASFRVHPAYLMQLLDGIAPLFPEIPFDARGLGEEFRSTWVAEYRNGQRTYSEGPWDYE